MSFSCHRSFPWLSGTEEPSQLARLGAVDVTTARVVSAVGGEVEETVITFGPDTGPGPAALRRQAIDCGGVVDRRTKDVTAWAGRPDGTTWAVHTAGPVVVAVVFTNSGLSQRQQQAVMARATAKVT